MKKFGIATLTALAALTASATEVGITAGTNYHQSAPYGFGNGCGFVAGPSTCTRGENRDEYGVTLGEKFGKYNLTAGFARSTGGSPVTKVTDGKFADVTQTRLSLVGGYDLATLGPVTFTAKVGAAYLDNTHEKDGFATTLGAGVSVPLTQKVGFGIDYARQYGQQAVSQYNGNRLSASLKYTF